MGKAKATATATVTVATTAAPHVSPSSSPIATSPLSYYGDVRFVAGDPSNPSSVRAAAYACTDADNTALMLGWAKGLRTGGWRVCDVGTADGRRVVDKTARVCQIASAKAWVDRENEMFVGAGSVLVKAGVNLATVRFDNNKVLRYKCGSFFAAHADRHRGDGHIGTLVAVVATPDVVGGELHVDTAHGATDVRVGNDKPFLAFLPLGRVHLVTPVTAGERYVVKAAVYGTTTADVQANTAFRHANMRSD